MALNSTEGDNAYDTAAVFKDKIAELTDGRVQVDLYGGAQLGSTTEVLEGMSVGVADIMCESVRYSWLPSPRWQISTSCLICTPATIIS